MPVGDARQALVAPVPVHLPSPLAQLARSWPRQPPVLPVQFRQRRDVRPRVLAGERPPRPPPVPQLRLPLAAPHQLGHLRSRQPRRPPQRPVAEPHQAPLDVPVLLLPLRQQRLAAVRPQAALQKHPHLLQALVRRQIDAHDHPPMVSTSPRAVRPGSSLVGNNPLVQAHVSLDNAASGNLFEIARH